MRSIFDRLNAGEPVRSDEPGSEEFDKALAEGRLKMHGYNNAPPSDEGDRLLLSGILGYELPEGCRISKPLYFDLGFNIRLGRNVMMNYGCVLLDNAEITIGDGSLIGPCVKMVTANHPVNPDMRTAGAFYTVAEKIVIGENVWIGAGATILPGITVGDGATIGAGSVVTHDVGPREVVAGNPARIIRKVRPGLTTGQRMPRRGCL